MSSHPHQRLVSAIGMMGASSAAGDAEAVAAFRAASRMLAQQGMSWRDVAERAFDTGRFDRRQNVPADSGMPRGSQPIDPSPMDMAFGDVFADIFRSMAGERQFGPGFQPQGGGFGSAPASGSKEFHKTRRKSFKRRLHGVDVPTSVKGVARVVDADRASRNGPMLVLEIEGDDAVWGPLVCFREGLQAEVRAAIGEGRTIYASIRTPANDRHMPQVVAVNAI